MGIDKGITDQLIAAFGNIVIIKIDFVKIVGIPVVAFGEFRGDDTCVTIGSDKQKVVITLLE